MFSPVVCTSFSPSPCFTIYTLIFAEFLLIFFLPFHLWPFNFYPSIIFYSRLSFFPVLNNICVYFLKILESFLRLFPVSFIAFDFIFSPLFLCIF